MTRTIVDTNHVMGGLLLTRRPDGRPVVRLLTASTDEERAAADDLARDGARATLPVETGAPPMLIQAVEEGRMPFRRAASLMAERVGFAARCAEGLATFFAEMAELQSRYPDTRTVGEACERAWWDGVFDEPGDPEREIDDRDCAATEAIVAGIALRLADGDPQQAERLTMAKLEAEEIGPEWRALREAAARQVIRAHLARRQRGEETRGERA